MGADIKRKDKIEKVMEFVERMRRVQEEARAVLKKVQEEIKRQTNRGRQEVEDWKKSKRVILSTKDLVFKERPAKKLMEIFVEPYEIEEAVSKNVVKLKLPSLMRIHLVVNVSRIVRYRKLVKGQKTKKPKPVEVEGVEEWEVDKILNKRKLWGIKKYLVH